MKRSLLFLFMLATAQFAFSQNWQLVCNTENTTGMFFINESTGWKFESIYSVQKTTDACKTWQLKIKEGSAMDGDTTPAMPGVYDIPFGSYPKDIFFVNDKCGWLGLIGGKGGVWSTTDGGATWKDNNKTLSETDQEHGEPYLHSVRKVCFVSSKKGWTCGEAEDKGKLGLYKSLDGGSNWRREPVNIFYDSTIIYDEDIDHLHYIPSQPDLRNLFFVDSLTGWAVGDRLFIYTRNGGKTWTRDTSRKYDNLENIFFLDRKNGWISEGSQLLSTNDAGISYKVIYEDTSYLPVTSVLFIDKNRGFIGAGRDPWIEMDGSLVEEGIGYLLETADGGKTWKIDLTGKSAFNKIQLLKNMAVITGNREGIYKLSIKK
jgi:photosystem II stability/assembly factor-like uncharacterized protein